MKNKHIIKQFMEENGIEFNKPFWVKTYNEIGMVKCRIIEDKKIGIPESEYYSEKEEKWNVAGVMWLMLVMFGEGYEIIPQPMYTLTEIKNRIMGEVKKQKKQWGDESELTPHQWLGLIQEEVGEIAQSVNETYLPNKTKSQLGGKENIQAEIYQAAALLIRFSEKLEKENKKR